MQTKTLTTLGQLRAGDRFYMSSDKNKKVLEVIEQHQANTSVNEATTIPGTYTHKYHMLKSSTLQVVFLRHTINSINETDALTGKI